MFGKMHLVFALALVLCGVPEVAARGHSMRSSYRLKKSRALAKTQSKMRVKQDVLTSDIIVLMSSPMEKKICYTVMSNFKAINGMVMPLVESGLSAPYGVAWDKDNSAIFVSDMSLRQIFRYPIKIAKVEGKKLPYELTTDGEKITVAENVEVKWMTVYSGELYYSDEKSKSIVKLSDYTIKQLVSGKVTAQGLSTESEQTAESLAEADASEALQNSQPSGEDTNKKTAAMVTMYQNGVNDNVGVPAGLVADGIDLFWVNQAEGQKKGSVVQANLHPAAPVTESNTTSPKFESSALNNATTQQYGIVETYNMLIYTSGVQYVYALPRTGGQYATLSSDFETSRGIVWDGDSTVYVADQGASAVWTIPCGRMASNIPRSKAVDFSDVYSLAIISVENDLAAANDAADEAEADPSVTGSVLGFLGLR